MPFLTKTPSVRFQTRPALTFMRFLLALLTCLGLWKTSQAYPGKMGIAPAPRALVKHLGLSEKGVLLYDICPDSPADDAGLKPGDVINKIGDKDISSFKDLLAEVSNFQAGDDVALQYQREGKNHSVNVQLAYKIKPPGPAQFLARAKFLQSLPKDKAGALVSSETGQALWKAGQRTKAALYIGKAIEEYPKASELKATALEFLKGSGDFTSYVQKAETYAKADPKSKELQLLWADALLAQEKNQKAEQVLLDLANNSVVWPGLPTETTAKALVAWTLTRFRQGKSLVEPKLKGPLAKRWSHPELATPQFWREQLKGKKPYQLTVDASKPKQIEFKKSKVFMGLVPQAMHGVTVKINGVEVPLAIVDTGASHTLVSTATAKAAGVSIGGASRTAAGSLAFTAKAGFIKKLEIGNITLTNVPVNVGNPPPMIFTKAKVALGIDVLHHIRFAIDYQNGKVNVTPASAKLPAPKNPKNVWKIPLFPFTSHTLSQGDLPSGKKARVLIDSGNFAYTLIWPTWGQENIPGHTGPKSSMWSFALSNPRQQLKGLKLGGKTIPLWNAMDMPPVTLNGIDLLDLLMGHDLLSQYDVTIDVPGRNLILESPGGTFALPKKIDLETGRPLP